MFLLRLLSFITLFIGTHMEVDAQLIKKREPEPYTVQQFNDDALLFKEHILYYMKFPKEIREQAVRGILKAQIYFDVEGKIAEVRPLSNVGFELEESLVKAVSKYKKNRQAITRTGLMGTDTASYYLFQLPIGMYNETYRFTSPGTVSLVSPAATPTATPFTTTSKIDFVLVADMVYLTSGYDNFEASAVLPRDYIDFLDGFTHYFYEYMHIKKNKLFTSSSPITGATMIKFRIDEEGKLTNMSHHGQKNTMSKILIDVFTGYASKFRWKHYTQDGQQDPLELGLYIDLRDKQKRTPLFYEQLKSDIFTTPK